MSHEWSCDEDTPSNTAFKIATLIKSSRDFNPSHSLHSRHSGKYKITQRLLEQNNEHFYNNYQIYNVVKCSFCLKDVL
jgi:hypothetical protein